MSKDEFGFREGPFYCSNCGRVDDNGLNQCTHGKRSITNCTICGRFMPEIPKNTAQALKLINLMIENPHLPVIPMVDYEVCCGDDHSYWGGSIGEIKKDVYFAPDTTIFSDMDRIEEHFEMEIEIKNPNTNFSREEMNKLIEEEIEKVDIKEAIYVYIEMPEAI